MANSKEIFFRLVKEIDLPESSGEVEAIALLLMAKRYGFSRAQVLIGEECEDDPDWFTFAVNRINQHEPVQYVLGEADFYGRSFAVSKAVLIPRPETELIITEAVGTKAGFSKILDIGTGSGCLAVTLALEFPKAQVYALDISIEALEVASQNAEQLDAPVQFIRHDILKGFDVMSDFDLIVSNPPYVTVGEKNGMSKNVLDYEPHIALFVPENDPLIFYRALAQLASKSLAPGGWLMAEINREYGKEVIDIYKSAGLIEVSSIKDLDGNYRIVKARKN